MKSKLTAKSVALLLEYTALKYIRTYKNWMNTHSKRDWEVVKIYSDILSKAGTDLSNLRSMALTNQLNFSVNG